MTGDSSQFNPRAGPSRTWRQRLVGLQGQLILSFSLLLMLALLTTSGLFVNRSRDALSDILGEQARQIAQTLALAAESPYELNDTPELHRLGKDLLRSRNIVLVVFTDPSNRPLAIASRDPDLTADKWSTMPESRPGTLHLMQVHRMHLASLGDYLQVTAPVFNVLSERQAYGERESGTRLLGYLTIGVSQANEQAQIQRVTVVGVIVGCLVFLICLPLASALVHRIFLPIRALVSATNRIAGGDYQARVGTMRTDEIGMLARSFNEMADRIREHQQALQEANRDLEGKVRQRTRELETTNQRLSSAIAEKEDFLRAVSHDLNAPLRNISGMAMMLLMKNREKFDEDVIHRLERIQKNVEVETELIGELLELSRIKTRRQKMELVVLDELVRDIAGIFENDLKQKAIAFGIEGNLPQLYCERARLRQVFQNLVDNAIKYMGEGAKREIHIASRLAADEVEFSVRDTGIGINPEDLPRMFCVFRRGRNAAELKVAGKGVGLASVKSIIEMYGGRIWVESEVGKGTTFRFTIQGKYVPALGGGEKALADDASASAAATANAA